MHFFDLYRHLLGEGRVINAHAEQREGTGQEDRVTCTVRHACGAIASHYHGFDQVSLIDRTDHRFVCELGDIRIEGWIPLTMTVNALVDDSGIEALERCCPGAEVEIIERYDAERGQTIGRGKPRSVTRRVRLRYCPEEDKQAVYAASIGELFADQLAFLRDSTHQRRVTEQNGRDSVALAEAAVKLAGGNMAA